MHCSPWLTSRLWIACLLLVGEGAAATDFNGTTSVQLQVKGEALKVKESRKPAADVDFDLLGLDFTYRDTHGLEFAGGVDSSGKKPVIVLEADQLTALEGEIEEATEAAVPGLDVFAVTIHADDLRSQASARPAGTENIVLKLSLSAPFTASSDHGELAGRLQIKTSLSDIPRCTACGNIFVGDEKIQQSLKGCDSLRSSGTGQLVVAEDGDLDGVSTFAYTDSNGLTLNGTFTQAGKRVSCELDQASVASLETSLANRFLETCQLAATVTLERPACSGKPGRGGTAISLAFKTAFTSVSGNETASGKHQVKSKLVRPDGGSSSSTSGPRITTGYEPGLVTSVLSDGQRIVGTVAATHPDPTEPLTFSIEGGADEASFTIDATTGLLSLTFSPTYANPVDADANNAYEVRVVVRDGTGAMDSRAISAVVAFSVDTLADVVDGNLTEGNRSLREAIDVVSEGSAISFSPTLAGQTLMLDAGQIRISKGVMIDGDLDNDGVADVTIDARGLDRIFEIDDGSGTADREIRLSGLWLSNGRVAGAGGAILNRENLSVVDCNLLGSRTTGDGAPGGAIASGPGRLSIQGTNVVGNATVGRSDGGGVSNEGGVLTVTSSVVAQNASGDSGGGIYSDGGDLTVRRSDIDDNTAAGRGGGIASSQGSYRIEQSTLRYNETTGTFTNGGGLFSVTNAPSQLGTISNSTIHGNRADHGGGGVYILFNRVRIVNSTITGNTAGRSGGGILADEFDPDFGSRTELASSIVASNSPSDIDFETTFTGLNPVTSRGGNVIGVGNATDDFAKSELLGGADPGLEPLDFYGGETPTRPPRDSSPAIDVGRNPDGLSTDQRGGPRTFGRRTDAGAVERNESD